MDAYAEETIDMVGKSNADNHMIKSAKQSVIKKNETNFEKRGGRNLGER